jgi:hypothetical protein
MQATGLFEVTTQPIAGEASYGRVKLDKRYHGALEASSSGEMLTGGDLKRGIAGYVAIETVNGVLDGKAGTFQLMHWGTMEGGKFDLRIAVVPGSGTGALAGVDGDLTIEVAPGGQHSYRLDYTLPEG